MTARWLLHRDHDCGAEGCTPCPTCSGTGSIDHLDDLLGADEVLCPRCYGSGSVIPRRSLLSRIFRTDRGGRP